MSVRPDHEHERTECKTSRLQPTHTTRVGALATESPWTLWHTGGSRQGHPRYTGAHTGKAVGGPTSFTTRRQTTRQGQVSRQTCFQRNQVLTHLETYRVAEPVGETGDPRRVVKLREQSRSGEVPNHQGDVAEKQNQSPRRRSPRRRSTRRPSTSRF